jgi:hypothetical protein
MEKASARLAAMTNRAPAPMAVVQLRASLVSMAVAVLQAALIAWFGFALSGRLEMVLKERAMTIESAKALEKLVTDMQDPGHDVERQMVFVRKIAMFGSEAIEPFVIMAAATGPYSERLPVAGLRLVALQRKEEVCRALVNAIAVKQTIDQGRFDSIEKLHKELQCKQTY